MSFSFWQGLIGAASALAIIAVSFMLERLFLDEWPWWGWTIVAAVAMAVAVWAGRVQSRRIQKHATGVLSEDTVLKLEEIKSQRRKDFWSFVSANSVMIYVIIALSILWIVKPLLGL